MLNPNTITGIKLEVTKVVTKYYELKKSLAMLIEFQFIVTTADVQVTTKAGATANLGASQKKSIGIALPVEAAKVEAGQESGVSGGLNVSYEFAKSSLQPGSRATTSRSFLCVNDGKGALSISPDVRLDANESAIGDTDPGMDPGWGNAPDWKITTNDSAFKAKIT